eukprot:gene9084-11129_t
MTLLNSITTLGSVKTMNVSNSKTQDSLNNGGGWNNLQGNNSSTDLIYIWCGGCPICGNRFPHLLGTRQVELSLEYEEDSNYQDFISTQAKLSEYTSRIVKLSILINGCDLFQLIQSCTLLEVLSLSVVEPDKITIPKGVIPSSVTKLSLMMELFTGDSKGPLHTLELGSIPTSVLDLSIDYNFVKHDLQLIPQSVTNLKWGDPSIDFNPFVPFVLPDSITELDFGVLPLPRSIPKSIKKLFLGYHFNSSLKSISIPESVKDLKFGYKFNQKIEPGDIPNGVRSVYLDYEFKQPLVKGSIPSSVTTLYLSGPNQNPPILRSDILPTSLTHLTIFELVSPETCLPSSLVYLKCNFDTIKTGLLPPTLETLILEGQVKSIEINSLPEGLTRLEFLSNLKIHLVEGTLPSSLKDLRFTRGVLIDKFPVIPNQVQTLFIGDNIAEVRLPIGSIPASVETLQLGSKFLYPFTKGMIPQNLKSLTLPFSKNLSFDYSINIPLEEIYLPPTLQEIHFNDLLRNYEYGVRDLSDFYQMIINLFSVCHGQLKIIYYNFTLLLLDPLDQYIYFVDDFGYNDGFILKTIHEWDKGDAEEWINTTKSEKGFDADTLELKPSMTGTIISFASNTIERFNRCFLDTPDTVLQDPRKKKDREILLNILFEDVSKRSLKKKK